jgi:hypothetical protein
MFISVRNRDLRRQMFPTSCWITAAHFVLQYLDVDISLAALHARFYTPDGNSTSIMSGAGRPRIILNEYAVDAGRFAKTINPQRAEEARVIAAITDNIRDDIPVIASLRSEQVKGFGHAVLITAVDPKTGTIGFKDPGTGTTPRPFGVDVRMVQYHELRQGFSYRYADRMRQNIFTYCNQIIYLRPLNEMNQFD